MDGGSTYHHHAQNVPGRTMPTSYDAYEGHGGGVGGGHGGHGGEGGYTSSSSDYVEPLEVFVFQGTLIMMIYINMYMYMCCVYLSIYNIEYTNRTNTFAYLLSPLITIIHTQ